MVQHFFIICRILGSLSCIVTPASSEPYTSVRSFTGRYANAINRNPGQRRSRVRARSCKEAVGTISVPL